MMVELTGLRTDPCRVVFLIQRAESWINVHGLWSLMRQDDRFLVDVRVIPYDVDEQALLRKRAACIAQLHRSGVPITESATDAPTPILPNQFDVAVFNAPYDRERASSFHFDRVAERVALTVYVPYGLVMGAGRRNRHYQYAQRTQRDAGLVIARSEAERGMYARYCPKGAAHVAVTGLPRLDAMHELKGFIVDPSLQAAIGGRYAVLWNSHFSFGLNFADGANYSTFDFLARPLFEYAASHPNIALIWRPHPALFRVLVDEHILGLDELDAFRSEVAAAGVILDERSDHRHAFAVSDMLLTDLGSFLVEYLATDKPLVYLHTEEGEGLNEEGVALTEYIDTARSAPDVIALIESYFSGEDSKRELRRLARERFLPMLDGQASRRVADRILTIMAPRTGDGLRSPIFSRLFTGLERIREKKQAKGLQGFRIDRWTSVLRLEAVEWVKRQPRMLRILHRLTGGA